MLGRTNIPKKYRKKQNKTNNPSRVALGRVIVTVPQMLLESGDLEGAVAGFYQKQPGASRGR